MRLRGCDELLEEFAERLRPLAAHAGPLLVQLPPSLRVGAELLGDFLAAAQAHADDFKVAVEFRNAS